VDGRHRLSSGGAEEAAHRVDHELVSVDVSGVEAAADLGSLESPERYVGYARSETFASRGIL